MASALIAASHTIIAFYKIQVVIVKKFEQGDKVHWIDFNFNEKRIDNVETISEQTKYWIEGMFGYFSADNLFATKNEAIDHLIEVLERYKDPIIKIEKRVCPFCGSDYSEFGGLRPRSNGQGMEFIRTCNNRNCDHELICSVREEYDVYMNQDEVNVDRCQHEKDDKFYALSTSTVVMTTKAGGLPVGLKRVGKCKKCGVFFNE